MIPFITSRTSTWRLLPPRLAGGINGSTCAHSSSVRSLGYRNLLRSQRPRFFAVHIGGASLESGHHFESQTIQRTQNVFGRTLRIWSMIVCPAGTALAGPCSGRRYLLTDPRQSDILQSGPGWRGPNAIRSIEPPRFHHAYRRGGGVAAHGAPAAGGDGSVKSPDAAQAVIHPAAGRLSRRRHQST